MKINASEITNIKNQFHATQNREDLVALINTANRLIYGDDFKPLTLKGFNYYTHPGRNKNRYSHFSIKKKSGGSRLIHAPHKSLKNILQPLNLVLNCIAEPHFKATGFVPGKSVVGNARMHTGNHYVYNLDLKDFFHSFDRNRVKLGFMRPPFNLNGDKEPLAFALASLCTHPLKIDGKIRTVLPQGAPTSPTLTNVLCVTLDRRLNGLAKRFNITYSRYADDITFSSHYNVFNKEEFLKELYRIIEEDQGFTINPVKTRLQKSGHRQEVTGLNVNEKANVSRRYVKQLRMYLYYWEKYGYIKAEALFRKDYKTDKGHVKKNLPSLRNVLFGKLEYLKMVKGEGDGTYAKLRMRYNRLQSAGSALEKVLAVWEKEGIEKAMAHYKPPRTKGDE